MNDILKIKAERTVKQLIEKNISVSTAESCTGGTVASAITSVPGASAVFSHGFVTYSVNAKSGILGVSNTTLTQYGAVCTQTAKEMAIGAKKASGSAIAVSVTGVAGPAKSEGKPVGLVYIAVATDDNCIARELNIEPVSREFIRESAAAEIFTLIDETLKRGKF